ncbi:MAG: hypothetical protein K6A82_09140 [Prevotella sp.]|nr:hypothetical protein [Prevotella sp.]
MITKDSIEAAYCFFHQKYQVYAFSNSGRQKDDIEYAISSYVESMSPELYALLAAGNSGFLLTHSSFAADMRQAIGQLEKLM